MDAAYTPGPWKSQPNGDDPMDGILVEVEGFMVAHVNCPEETIREGNEYKTYTHPDVLAANASLIAAAPDLLGALQRCDQAFAGWQVGQVPGRPEDILELTGAVRAAIAKAEGR